jgi:chitodextrinase
MRIAPFPLDPSNFALGAAVPLPLPLAAGALETTFIPGLAEDRRYWVAMRSRDAAGNWSPISNVSEIAVGHAFPSAVNDLRVSASGDSSLTVVWTATGDNGRIGRPKRYLVRVSPEPIVNAAFPGLALGVDVDATVDAGGEEHATVTGLDPSKRWWVALRAEDANGNESLISNIASSLLGRFGRTSGAVLAARRTPSPVPVELAWQGDDSPGTASVMRVMDVTGRVIARVPLSGSGGIALWSGASERGNRVPAGVYFAELRSGAFTARTRFVLLR